MSLIYASKAGFLSLSSTNILSWMILGDGWGTQAVLCIIKIFSSIPGHYPLDASRIPPYSSCDNQNASGHHQMSLGERGGQNHSQLRNHCSTECLSFLALFNFLFSELVHYLNFFIQDKVSRPKKRTSWCVLLQKEAIC